MSMSSLLWMMTVAWCSLSHRMEGMVWQTPPPESSSSEKYSQIWINSIVLSLKPLLFHGHSPKFVMRLQWQIFWSSYVWLSVSAICCSRTEKEKLGETPFHPNRILKVQPEPVKTEYIKDTSFILDLCKYLYTMKASGSKWPTTACLYTKSTHIPQHISVSTFWS